jgi:hypothetical protein
MPNEWELEQQREEQKRHVQRRKERTYFGDVARRLAGGDVQAWLDKHEPDTD